MRINPKNSTGSVHIAVLTNVDTKAFRATAKLMETGAIRQCVITPSPYMGHLPAENSLALVYTYGSHYCRYLLGLGDVLEETEWSLSQRASIGEVPVGDIPVVKPGEVYIGQKGRVHLNANGDVALYTEAGNLRFVLTEKTARANLEGNNLSLSTLGAGVVIKTTASVPGQVGDGLRLERNVAVQLVPEEITGVTPLVPSNLAYIEMDVLGGITAKVVAGGEMLLNSIGDVYFGNLFGHLEIDPDGEVKLTSTKNVGIEALLTVAIDGAQPGFSVLLNANPGPTTRRGVARVDDLTTSTSVTDPAFWLYVTRLQACLTALAAAIVASPTTPLDGGASYKAGLVAALALAPLPVAAPVAVISKVTTGSLTVTAGG